MPVPQYNADGAAFYATLRPMLYSDSETAWLNLRADKIAEERGWPLPIARSEAAAEMVRMRTLAGVTFRIDTICVSVNRPLFIVVSSQCYPARKLQSQPVPDQGKLTGSTGDAYDNAMAESFFEGAGPKRLSD